jgi:hypothetical protein
VSAIEMVTIMVCSVAIGASVASVLTFLFFGALRKKTIIRDHGGVKVPEETASVLGLLAGAFHDHMPDADREALKALVVRYSETPLTSVLSDDTERSYLFDVLGDPSRLPWKSEERQRGARSK